MPCYDPPPAWEGDARKSAEEAAKLLCGMTRAMLDAGEVPPQPVLRWYIDHRKVDLRQLREPHYRAPGTRAEIDEVLRDIRRVEQLLV